MRLYYHPESDSIFWAPTNEDGAQDVTDDKRFHQAARERGLRKPDPWEMEPQPELTVPAVKGIAGAIVQSYKTWQRKPADLYPTPVDGTESLIPVLKAMRRPDGKPIKRIWEPACGDGRLARVLEWHGFEVVSTDLREYPGYGDGGVDFLSDVEELYGLDLSQFDAIVTNPPFSLAEDFIRRALSICPNVAMLLKQTYWNVGGRSQGLWFDHMPDLELKVTWRLAFLANERGNAPLMDCMWVVWNGDNQGLPLKRLDESGPQQMCVTEPLPRLRYPGYGGIGMLPGLQVLEGEMFDLGETIRKLLP